MKSPLRLVEVNTIEGFKSLKDDWNVLHEKSDRNTIFSSWDWMYTWWEVFHNELSRKLFILCLYQDKQLVGIAPFHIYKHYPKSFIQGRTLQFIGSGNKKEENVTSEYLDFIVQPDLEGKVVDRVSEYLIEHKRRWEFADFEYLLEDALIFKCFKDVKKVAKKKIKDGVRFFIPPKNEISDYSSQLGKRWQKMLNRKTRRLESDGEVRVVTTSTEESLDPALQLLADMHCSRIKEKVGYCAFDSEKFSSFHEKILKRLSTQNKALIKTIYLNDEPLATYYVFTDKAQWHYYQSGFHSKHANRYSPLFLLICREITETLKENKTFDFMYEPSSESYKKEQYAAEYEPMYRLYWSTMPMRFFIFNCAKFLQEKYYLLKINLKTREKA